MKEVIKVFSSSHELGHGAFLIEELPLAKSISFFGMA